MRPWDRLEWDRSTTGPDLRGSCSALGPGQWEEGSFDPGPEALGTPLQYSCLENPLDGEAWWAAVYGVTHD